MDALTLRTIRHSSKQEKKRRRFPHPAVLNGKSTLLKSFSQGPVQDHAKASDSISLGSSQDLRTRTCQRPWARSSCQEPEENLTRSSQKDLLLPERILQDLDTRTSRKPPTRAFIQAPLRHGMCKLLNKRPFRKDLTRISTRSSVKDLCRIMQQVRRKDFSRTLTRARLGESLRTPRRRLCASLRGRNAHGHVQVPRKYAKFYCKNATKQMASHDPTPASTPTVRTPQCGHTVWGITIYSCATVKPFTKRNISHSQ